MKISIFSHAVGLGGAELAFLNLITLLKYQGHDLIVFAPRKKGALITELKSLGVVCKPFLFTPSLPKTSGAIRAAYSDKSAQLFADLRSCSPDLVIVNTLALLNVQLVAAKCSIPCMVYAHEDLDRDYEIASFGWSGGFYNYIASQAASHILCGSKFTQNCFDINKSTILHPFDLLKKKLSSRKFDPISFLIKTKEFINRLWVTNNKVSLFVVGNKSLRKNASFAITVVKALQIRGNDCNLYLIGSKGGATKEIKSELLIRKTKNVHFYKYLNKPFSIGGNLKINLICSTTEPFGLTTTDCFSLGIPTISSKSGGPCEVLEEDLLYEINDLDQCVRKIENVIANYDQYKKRATDKHDNLCEIYSLANGDEILNSALDAAITFGSAKIPKEIESAFECMKSDVIDLFPQEIAFENIAEISKLTSVPLTFENIAKLTAEEKLTPGTAIQSDIKHFDVVPFADSSNMANLYKNGLGLAIELAAYIYDPGKQEMLRFIHMHLIEDTHNLGYKLNLLCLGDGLGVDSIWFSNLGVNVDYMDYDQSMISLCAEKNIQYFLNKSNDQRELRVITKLDSTYDAIVCLEVIEHVSNAREFLKFTSSHLTDNGKLFISDCFSGVVERWPTHLYENEQFAHEMHLLALPFMRVVDVNLNPYAKPYVMKKNRPGSDLRNSCNPFINKRLTSEYIKSKRRLGY